MDYEYEEAARPEKITVVMVEPGKLAEVKEIGTSLEELQEAVGGWIETYYPFEDPNTCIVCNDEGKINGMDVNRAIYYEDSREVADVICGPFFICDCSTESFGSLDSERLEKYKAEYEFPEHFFRVGKDIVAIPYHPAEHQNTNITMDRIR